MLGFADAHHQPTNGCQSVILTVMNGGDVPGDDTCVMARDLEITLFSSVKNIQHAFILWGAVNLRNEFCHCHEMVLPQSNNSSLIYRVPARTKSRYH